MRMPEAGPFGETFLDASERATTGADLVKRSLGGWVESVVTLRTQSRFEPPGAEAFFAVRRLFTEADSLLAKSCFLMAMVSAA